MGVPAESEATPKASAGFSLPTPSSRFIPKKFVRKISGLTGGGGSAPTSPALASPAVDSQGNLVPPVPSSNQKQRSSSRERKKFGRSWSSGGGVSSGSGASSGNETPVTPGGTTPTPSTSLSTTSLGAGKRLKSDYEFKGTNDIVGIVMLEIQGADDLPRLANSEFIFLSMLLPRRMFFSDTHWMGYGPVCRHLIRKEGFSHSSHSTLAEPCLGREDAFPRSQV